ncbi:MAG: hypothetical protein KAS32_14195 [Candidatus Peribacteraceae bacterium]|nr:hypothetical protein [Candidatus Peribacteraceae bacterium]
MGIDIIQKPSGSNPLNEFLQVVDGKIVANTDILMSSYAIKNLASPSEALDGVTKSYVDTISSGLFWQAAIDNFYDPTSSLPVGSLGDRYTASATANGWTLDNIYEWNGSSWDEIVTEEGFTAWYNDIDVSYVFNGTNWVKYGTTLNHNNLINTHQDVSTTATPLFNKITFPNGSSYGIRFGDGDAGIYENDDDQLYITSTRLMVNGTVETTGDLTVGGGDVQLGVNGTIQWGSTSARIRGSHVSGGYIQYYAPPISVNGQISHWFRQSYAPGAMSSGDVTFGEFEHAVNQSGTAGYTSLLIDVTETAIGSGTKNLIDAKVDTVSKFSVSNLGEIISTADSGWGLTLSSGLTFTDDASSNALINCSLNTSTANYMLILEDNNGDAIGIYGYSDNNTWIENNYVKAGYIGIHSSYNDGIGIQVDNKETTSIGLKVIGESAGVILENSGLYIDWAGSDSYNTSYPMHLSIPDNSFGIVFDTLTGYAWGIDFEGEVTGSGTAGIIFDNDIWNTTDGGYARGLEFINIGRATTGVDGAGIFCEGDIYGKLVYVTGPIYNYGIDFIDVQGIGINVVTTHSDAIGVQVKGDTGTPFLLVDSGDVEKFKVTSDGDIYANNIYANITDENGFYTIKPSDDPSFVGFEANLSDSTNGGVGFKTTLGSDDDIGVSIDNNGDFADGAIGINLNDCGIKAYGTTTILTRDNSSPNVKIFDFDGSSNVDLLTINVGSGNGRAIAGYAVNSEFIWHEAVYPGKVGYLSDYNQGISFQVDQRHNDAIAFQAFSSDNNKKTEIREGHIYIDTAGTDSYYSNSALQLDVADGGNGIVFNKVLDGYAWGMSFEGITGDESAGIVFYGDIYNTTSSPPARGIEFYGKVGRATTGLEAYGIYAADSIFGTFIQVSGTIEPAAYGINLGDVEGTGAYIYTSHANAIGINITGSAGRSVKMTDLAGLLWEGTPPDGSYGFESTVTDVKYYAVLGSDETINGTAAGDAWGIYFGSIGVYGVGAYFNNSYAGAVAIQIEGVGGAGLGIDCALPARISSIKLDSVTTTDASYDITNLTGKVYADSTSTSQVAWLPDASTVLDHEVSVKQISTNSNTLTVKSYGGTIEGIAAATGILYPAGQGHSYLFHSDGTNWWIH